VNSDRLPGAVGRRALDGRGFGQSWGAMTHARGSSVEEPKAHTHRFSAKSRSDSRKEFYAKSGFTNRHISNEGNKIRSFYF
jgi:hypothetical protein